MMTPPPSRPGGAAGDDATTPGWRLGDILANTVASTPQATALIGGADRTAVSYHQLDAAAAAVSDALIRHGLRPRNVVALQGANTPEFVAALLAAARAGIIVAPLDPALPDIEARQRLDMLGARVTLVGPTWPDHGSRQIDGCPHWHLSGAEVRTDATPRNSRAPAGLGDDDALIMLTSGTTGTPKMVPWTHRSIAAAITAIKHSYGLTATDATVAAMPLFHGHGLVATLLSTLASGGTVVLPARGKFSAHTFWDDMAAARATWYTAVPTIHQILLNRAAPGQPDALRDHGRLRFIRSCSAPLSAASIGRLETAFGVPVLAAYGMTEATHQVSSTTLDDDTTTRHHTVGKPAGATAQVVDTDGRPQPAGTAGEIWLTGPTISRGYLGNPGKTGNFDRGWLHTGDLGVLEARGDLAVTGRIKNIINRGGEKISPEHVEEVLAAYPGVAEVAVFGQDDPLYGERVAAAVVTAPGTDIRPDELIAYCRTRLAPYEVPDHVALTAHLPLTAKGDLDRAALAQQFT
jgi:acyl-CoA synthetase (AMP-forming)/AMP-acid ligase II